MRPLKSPYWSRLFAVGLPYFQQVRQQAFGGLAILVILLLTINGMNVVNSYVGRDFMTALADGNGSRFFTFALILAGVFAVSTIIEVFARFAEQRLGLSWRAWLTGQLLDRYLANRTYLRIAGRPDIDNPDQRISQDVMTFTTTTLSILVLSMNGLMTVLAFSSVLWLITPWLFLAALAYALAGSLGTLWLGRRLIALNNQQLRREADFRYGLGRVREHAEEVAQVAGEDRQRRRLDRWLARVVENFRSVVQVTRNLGFFTVAYKYMPQIIPAAIVAPLYFRGEVEFGTVTQAAMAFAQVQGAFSLFVLQFQEVSVYLAVTDRLSALWEATESGAKKSPTGGPLPRMPAKHSAKRATPPTAPPAVEDESPTSMIVELASDARRLTYEQVTLWAAEPRRLVIKELNLEVSEGQPLALTGHGDAGAALLLATAGVWDEGQGRIRRPGPGGIMFVFHPRMSAAGPLRSLLLDSLGREAPDDQVHAVLAEVGLADAVARHGGLDAERDWSADLSNDELLALIFARLLLAAPRFAFLDCLAGASDKLFRERLYPALARSPITFVTVACPPALLDFHRSRLDLREDGGWNVDELKAKTA